MPRIAGYVPLVLIFACVPNPPPLIGETSETTGTTADLPECQTDADCPNVCVDNHCVECANDAHCQNPTPICVGEVCQGCSLPSQCPNSAPICEGDACIPCSIDEQCQNLGKDICIDQGSPNPGTCSGCFSNADCPPEYPECVAMQCTVACKVDEWDPYEPLKLADHLLGGVLQGYVCPSDPTDVFELALSGPGFVSLNLQTDTKPGNADMALLDAKNVVLAESESRGGLDVIHVRLPLSSTYRVRVSLESGPAGVPFKLSYRTLLE